MRKTLLTILILPVLAACGKTGPATIDVQGVHLDKTELNLAPGQTARLEATLEPADATDPTLTWKTEDKNIATVREGTVTAVSEGTTNVIVRTYSGGFTATCQVTVADPDKPEPPAPGPDPQPDAQAPAAYGTVPTDGQVAWQRQELIMFYHFGPATFSGYDGEKATYSAAELVSHFQPSALDCDQWVKTAADNGFKEVILTAKHHDGFSLWDNPESTCDIAACPEPYNKDILKLVSDACKKYGVHFGIYLSPWDKLAGSESAYEDQYINAIKSLAEGQYGTLTEFWLDGNHAGNLNFSNVNAAIQAKNPDVVIFSNVGPGCRWVGNEDGNAGETNWSTFSPSAHGASQSSLPGAYGSYLWSGDKGGSAWIPAECDFSIQDIGDNNGWFWGPDDGRKSAKRLMEIYYQSVGRNSVFLMNVPPNRTGVIDAKEKEVLEAFKQMRDQVFGTDLAAGAKATASSIRGKDEASFGPAHLLDGDYDTYFATDDGVKTADITFTLDGSKTFNRVQLQEYIPLGQRVERFEIQVRKGGQWSDWGDGEKTTIGHKRIILGSTVTADAVRLKITSALACPVLNGFALYNDTVSGL
ncbi:MAG: alpha-L-fucosidase [Bacteroidales bacterium]|nr:alpha-L-fucosidase [Bacteroidales bacterium]